MLRRPRYRCHEDEGRVPTRSPCTRREGNCIWDTWNVVIYGLEAEAVQRSWPPAELEVTSRRTIDPSEVYEMYETEPKSPRTLNRRLSLQPGRETGEGWRNRARLKGEWRSRTTNPSCHGGGRRPELHRRPGTNRGQGSSPALN